MVGEMNEITGIKLKTKSGEIDITMEEARNIYSVLNKIFGESQYYIPSYPLSPSVPFYPYDQWTWTT